MADIGATYRGFRRQALYTLTCLLGDHNGEKVFQPEGIEDLDIFDNAGQLLEVVQVKDYSNALGLGDLGPKKPNGFFARQTRIRRNYPDVAINLVHFGGLGHELSAAFENDGPERASVARKVARHGYATESEVCDLLSVVTSRLVTEPDLLQNYDAQVREGAAGLDPEAALDLMIWWIYKASEKSTPLQRSAALTRLLDIGRFLHERASLHQEWYSTIKPLLEFGITENRQSLLNAEFARGVSVDYEHICAKLDVVRMSKLQAIADQFNSHLVVVLRGASGQGKSALAYRYLHDCVPEGWSFQVKVIGGRIHAMNVASALVGHARALNVPMVVFIDVSPKDDGWTDLVQELARHPDIGVLIAIREEDWARTQLYGHNVKFGEVELDFTREEAVQIWDGIPSERRSPRLGSFSDAWARCGERNLLLEFVHFVTAGTTLKDRLRQQILARRLEIRAQRADAAELKLLLLVAIASVSEARILAEPTIELVQLGDASLTIDLLQREYLLRVSDDGEFLEGLHSVRSSILVDLLTGPNMYSWQDAAISCIRLLDPADISGFLLSAAVHHPDSIEYVLSGLLESPPKGWAAMAGIVRTLIWLGVKDYAYSNSGLINDVINDCGKGWWTILDTDISDSMPGVAESLMQTFAGIVSIERLSVLQGFRRRQRPKDEVWNRLREWISDSGWEPEIPGSRVDWRVVGEVLYWASQVGVNWAIVDWLPEDDLTRAISQLPLWTVGDVIVGLYRSDPRYIERWLSVNRRFLVERFRREEQVFELLDDNQKLTAHFLTYSWAGSNPELSSTDELKQRFNAPHFYRPETLADSKSGAFFDSNPVHTEALNKINLMRKLFPDRESYGCQGFGHLIPSLEINHDDSLKSGIPKSKLPNHWAVQINALFGGVVMFPRRPDDWHEFAIQLFRLEHEMAGLFRTLNGILAKAISSHANSIVLDKFTIQEILHLRKRATFPPRAPQCAIDPLGYVDENRIFQARVTASESPFVAAPISPALIAWRSLFEAIGDVCQSLENFLVHFTQLITSERHIDLAPQVPADSGSPEQTSGKTALRMSLLSLSKLRSNIATSEAVFREFLGEYFQPKQLDEWVQEANEAITELWIHWFHHAISQPASFPQPSRILALPEWNIILNQTRVELEAELARISANGITVKTIAHGLTFNSEESLWITVDSRHVAGSYGMINEVFDAVVHSLSTIGINDIRDLVIDDQWKNVIVVPLLCGKSLSGQMWCVPTHVLMSAGTSSGLSKHYFVARSIPAISFAESGIEAWNSAELTSIASIVEASGDFWSIGNHLSEVSLLPIPDSKSVEMLRMHLHRIDSQLTKSLEKFNKGLEDLGLVQFTWDATTNQDEDYFKYLNEARDAMNRLVDLSVEGLTEKSLKSWVTALEVIVSPAMLVYLLAAEHIVNGLALTAFHGDQ